MFAEQITTGRRHVDPTTFKILAAFMAAYYLAGFAFTIWLYAKRLRRAWREWRWEGSEWEKANGVKPFDQVRHELPP